MFLDNLNPLPVNQHGSSHYDTVATVLATASVTPSVLNCLALAATTFGANGDTLSSVSGGWTADASDASTYHGTFAAHRNALTTDTSTAISNTFTVGTSTQAVTEILLIAPSPGGSPSIVQETYVALGTHVQPTFTLGSAPVAGNLLVAFVSYSTFNTPTNSVATPAGWQLVERIADGYFEAMSTFTRIVQPGDGTTWTFNQVDDSDWSSGVMYEVQQALTVSQTFEFFNNFAGQFGIYDKTNGSQAITVYPSTDGHIFVGYPGGPVNIGSGNGTVTLGGSGGNVYVNNGMILRCEGDAVFSGGMQLERTAVSSSTYNISSSADYILGCDPTSNAITVTLPDVTWAAQVYIVKDETGHAAAHNITVATSGGQTIDGASSVTISTNYGVVRVYSNGSNWNQW